MEFGYATVSGVAENAIGGADSADASEHVARISGHEPCINGELGGHLSVATLKNQGGALLPREHRGLDNHLFRIMKGCMKIRS